MLLNLQYSSCKHVLKKCWSRSDGFVRIQEASSWSGPTVFSIKDKSEFSRARVKNLYILNLTALKFHYPMVDFHSNISFFVWFDSLHPINNLSVMLGRVFLAWTSTKLGLMCHAQGHDTVKPVRLQPEAPRSLVKHSTTEPLHSLDYQFEKCNSFLGCLFKKWIQVLECSWNPEYFGLLQS